MGYYGYGTMGWGGGVWMSVFAGVWLIVGILLIVWLWQNIDKK